MKVPDFRMVVMLVFVSLFCATVYSQAQAKTFTLRSLHLGGQISMPYFYNDFGGKGGNISPDLQWENAPAETKSFAVTMYDPATNTGSGWWHWVLFNIDGAVKDLKEDAGSNHQEYLPKGSVSSLNDFGKYGYSGALPIPGSGYHPYIITVYALKSKLDLDKNATPAFVGFNLNSNIIAKASIIAYLFVP